MVRFYIFKKFLGDVIDYLFFIEDEVLFLEYIELLNDIGFLDGKFNFVDEFD